ncbi:MAG: AAA family ATPase [Pyrodictiaceae archaeon]
MGRLIVVAGVPGTGKSLLGSRLARRLGCRFTTVSWIVLEKGLWRAYDPLRRSFIIDEEGLRREIKRVIEGGCMILETHWLEPLKEVTTTIGKIIVTRTRPTVLLRRLKRRGWPPRKIAENVEAEMLGIIALEAARLLPERVWEVDTTSSPEESLEKAMEGLAAREARCCIDWLSILGEEEIEELLNYTTRHLG